MAAYRRVYDSRHRRLTAKNRDQLRDPTLGSRVRATFTFNALRRTGYEHLRGSAVMWRRQCLIGRRARDASILAAEGRDIRGGQLLVPSGAARQLESQS